jgi:hypothetical protein
MRVGEEILDLDLEWCRAGVEGGEATSIFFALTLGFLLSTFLGLWVSESRGDCMREGDESARSGFARRRLDDSESDRFERREEEEWEG